MNGSLAERKFAVDKPEERIVVGGGLGMELKEYRCFENWHLLARVTF
jgi:hypothetical protein